MSGPALIENVLYPTFDTGYITPFISEDETSYSSVVQYLHFNNLSNTDLKALYQAQKLKFDYNPELKEALKNSTGVISFPFLQDQFQATIYSKVLSYLRAEYKDEEDVINILGIELGLVPSVEFDNGDLSLIIENE